MTFKRIVAFSCANTAALVVKLKDTLVEAGWELYDDQSGATPPYYVFKSHGEAPTTKAPCYLWIRWSSTADRLEFLQYVTWNNTAHTGGILIGATSTQFVSVDDDGAQYLWIYTNKDFVVIVVKVGTTYQEYQIWRAKSLLPGFGVIQSDVSLGSNVVLQLGKGQAATFTPLSKVMIINTINTNSGRDNDSVIASVDTVNNTITLATLTYNFPAGSVVGYFPRQWMAKKYTVNPFSMGSSASGTAANAQTALDATPTKIPAMAESDPEGGSDVYFLGLSLYLRSSGMFAITDRWILWSPFSSASHEDTVSVEIIEDEVQATSGGSNTISNTSKSWETNIHAGKAVIITDGTGVGQIRTILSNTSNQLTADEQWSVNPDNTSLYIIANQAYRHFGLGNASYCLCVIEGGEIERFPSNEITTTTSTTTTTTV